MKKNLYFLGCLGLIAFFYLLFPIKALSFQHDAIPNLLAIKNSFASLSSSFFHPHHFLTSYLYIFFGKALSVLFPSVSLIELSILSMRWLNISFTFLSLVGLYWLSNKRLLLGKKRSFWVVTATAASFLIWSYASSAEIYAPSLCFFVWSIVVFFQKDLGFKQVILGSILVGLSILTHVLTIALIPGLAYYLWRKKKHKEMLVSFLTLALIAMLSYGVYFLTFNSVSEVMTWLFTGGGNLDVSFRKVLVGWVIGFGKSIIGPYFVFANPNVAAYISTKLFPFQYLQDEIFLVKNMPYLEWIMLCSATVLTVGILGFLSFKAIIHIVEKIRKDSPERTYILTLLILFIGFVGISLVSKDAHNSDMHVHSLVIFWLLMGVGVEWMTKNVLIFFILALVFVNYWGSIKWLSSQKNDLFFQTISEIKKSVDSHESVILDLKRNFDPYIRFYDVQATIAYLSDGNVMVTDLKNGVNISNTVQSNESYMNYNFEEIESFYQKLNQLEAEGSLTNGLFLKKVTL